MKIAILSFYSGMVDRGVEVWAKTVKQNLVEKWNTAIISGEKYKSKINWNNKNNLYWIFLILKHTISTVGLWSNSDLIIPTNGGFQSLLCRLGTWIYRKPMVIFGHAGPGADDKWNLLCSPNFFVAFSDITKYLIPNNANHSIDFGL